MSEVDQRFLGRRAWLALIDGAERLLCVCGTNSHPHPYCYPGGPLELLCSGCLTPWMAPAPPRAKVGPDPIALISAYEANRAGRLGESEEAVPGADPGVSAV